MHLYFILILFSLPCAPAFSDFDGSGDETSFSLHNEELIPYTGPWNHMPERKRTKSKPLRRTNKVNRKVYPQQHSIYSDPCKHAHCGHVCQFKNNNPYCSCRNGYKLHSDGKSCIDFDECTHFNGGCQQLCVNTVGSYHCECKEHYKLRKDSKVTCEASCLPPCLNNGECIGPNVCSCPPGYLQPYCSPICNPACANGGICKRHNLCKCPERFTGPTCLTALCDSSCLNGGRCIAPNICQCSSGYYGQTCEHAICTPPCENRGTCIKVNQCVCQTGFTGQRCQTRTVTGNGACNPHCENNPGSPLNQLSRSSLKICKPLCQNGGQCITGNKCICPNGFYGSKCQHRKCPIVTFTSKVTRMIRVRVTETILSDCNQNVGKKCVTYRLVPKIIPKTFYTTGYRINCS